jgi:hypothetical protein
LRIAAAISSTWSAISQPPFSALAPCATASTPEAGTNFSHFHFDKYPVYSKGTSKIVEVKLRT